MAVIINAHMTTNATRFMPIVPGMAPIPAERAQARVAIHAATARPIKASVMALNGARVASLVAVI